MWYLWYWIWGFCVSATLNLGRGEDTGIAQISSSIAYKWSSYYPSRDAIDLKNFRSIKVWTWLLFKTWRKLTIFFTWTNIWRFLSIFWNIWKSLIVNYTNKTQGFVVFLCQFVMKVKICSYMNDWQILTSRKKQTEYSDFFYSTFPIQRICTL